MYYLFHVHGILPGDYYRRTQGEKDLLWALSSYEADAAVKNRGARTGHRRKK